MARHDIRHEKTGRYIPRGELGVDQIAPTPGSDADISAIGDAGHKDTIMGDHVVLHNAHPHIDHPIGYHAEHIIHDARDKKAEHHPHKGLMDYAE